MKKIGAILTILVVIILFQGCGGKQQYQPPKDGDTLTSQQIVDLMRMGWPVHLKGSHLHFNIDFTGRYTFDDDF